MPLKILKKIIIRKRNAAALWTEKMWWNCVKSHLDNHEMQKGSDNTTLCCRKQEDWRFISQSSFFPKIELSKMKWLLHFFSTYRVLINDTSHSKMLKDAGGSYADCPIVANLFEERTEKIWNGVSTSFLRTAVLSSLSFKQTMSTFKEFEAKPCRSQLILSVKVRCWTFVLTSGTFHLPRNS